MDTSRTSPKKNLAVNEKGISKMSPKKPKKERAAAPTTAPKHYLQSELYQKSEPLSSLKSEIGILLFCLQFPIGHEASRIGWMLFERLLRRYISQRIPQSALVS